MTTVGDTLLTDVGSTCALRDIRLSWYYEIIIDRSGRSTQTQYSSESTITYLKKYSTTTRNTISKLFYPTSMKCMYMLWNGPNVQKYKKKTTIRRVESDAFENRIVQL